MSLTQAQKRKIEEEKKYRHAISVSSSPEKHGVPLLLSLFVPGLGQIVKGQLKKGLLILFAPVFAFIIIMIGSINTNGSAILALLGQIALVGTILYIWQLIDAYNN